MQPLYVCACAVRKCAYMHIQPRLGGYSRAAAARLFALPGPCTAPAGRRSGRGGRQSCTHATSISPCCGLSMYPSIRVSIYTPWANSAGSPSALLRGGRGHRDVLQRGH
eukprot:3035290-Rhodomonas_salina.2